MFNKFKISLEQVSTTPLSWLIGLSGVMMVRFFLEALSSPSSSGIIASDASTLIHYYLFFLGVALSTLIFLWFALPSWRKVLPQFVSMAFLLIILAPLIDLVASRGNGFHMTYLFETPKQMLHSFLTFFGPSWRNGITLGIRIELGILLALSATLIYSVRKHVLKTLGFTLILYTIVFAFGSLPGILSFGQGDQVMNFLGNSIVASATFTDNIHSTLLYSSPTRALEIGFNFFIAKILFLICFMLSGVWFFLSQREKFMALLKNSRPERVLAYFSTLLFGVLLAHIISPPIAFGWIDYISLLILFLSFYLSWMFAVCVNDIVDQEIDAISNPNRPLIQGALTILDLKNASYLFLISSLIAGYLSGFYVFFSLLTFTALYYIYSAPPTRFKKIPFLASFLISLCKLSCVLAGFFIFSNSKVLTSLPTAVIFGIPIFFTLFVGIRDIKDIEGDRKNGIQTPAVLFGEKFIGLSVALAYLLVPLFFNFYYLYIIALPASILSYYYVNKKPYREKPLFIIYFAFVTLLGISVFSLVHLANLFLQ